MKYPKCYWKEVVAGLVIGLIFLILIACAVESEKIDRERNETLQGRF